MHKPVLLLLAAVLGPTITFSGEPVKPGEISLSALAGYTIEDVLVQPDYDPPKFISATFILASKRATLTSCVDSISKSLGKPQYSKDGVNFWARKEPGSDVRVYMYYASPKRETVNSVLIKRHDTGTVKILMTIYTVPR